MQFRPSQYVRIGAIDGTVRPKLIKKQYYHTNNIKKILKNVFLSGNNKRKRDKYMSYKM